MIKNCALLSHNESQLPNLRTENSQTPVQDLVWSNSIINYWYLAIIFLFQIKLNLYRPLAFKDEVLHPKFIFKSCVIQRLQSHIDALEFSQTVMEPLHVCCRCDNGMNPNWRILQIAVWLVGTENCNPTNNWMQPSSTLHRGNCKKCCFPGFELRAKSKIMQPSHTDKISPTRWKSLKLDIKKTNRKTGRALQHL